eukprot:TRINITY_DN2515_c5_g2_i1.p1 TRINITY_DN2515_c5_g2~~TRINITY_DN2515_c5_g2_i1.p1  ORF type:complete len:325 (+),score=71.18 TRINITY_DN2515_c5_g2_i1:299-1273(+)
MELQSMSSSSSSSSTTQDQDDDTEFTSVDLDYDHSLYPVSSSAVSHRVRTEMHGTVSVSTQGDTDLKIALLTIHDVGVNHRTCFNRLINHPLLAAVVSSQLVIHVDLPGQEDDAADLDAKGFPSVEEMTDIVDDVLTHFGVDKVILLGAGIGGAVACQYAVLHTKRVRALLLINSFCSQWGWQDWMGEKAMISSLWYMGMTATNVEAWLARFFTFETLHYNTDLAEECRVDLPRRNARNLSLFLAQTINEKFAFMSEMKKLRVPVLHLVGKDAPFALDMSLSMNWSRFELAEFDGGRLLSEENPQGIVPAILLFLEGIGFRKRK